MSATTHAPPRGTDRTTGAVGTRPDRAGPGGGARKPQTRTVLLLVVGLHLVAETALTPFLPVLFRTLFGVQDLAATGTFLWVCRVAGCLAFPLWGLAARRWPAERLVLTGLCASTLLYAGMVLAPDYATFTALAAAVVATNAALLLAYPALISSYERGNSDEDGGESPSRQRLRGIRAYVAVFHGAVVVSTLVGAAVMALPSPRWGLLVFVLLGATLAVLCRRALRGLGPVRPRGRAATPAEPEAPPAPEAPASTPPAQSRPTVRIRPRHVVAVAALAVVFEVATNVVRPFFTEYTATGGLGTTAGAAQFLLASLAALAALPLVEPAHRLLGRGLLPVGFLLAAAGLLWQCLGPDPLTLTAGRIVFGVGLGLGHVALDLRMFGATGTAAPAYAAVQTARIGGLFVSPVLATLAATADLVLPLVLGAVLYVLGASLAPFLTPHPHRKEASRPWP
jgi:MFS family permease